jgi:hypothetical protein
MLHYFHTFLLYVAATADDPYVCRCYVTDEHIDLNLTTYVSEYCHWLTDEYKLYLLAYIGISSVFGRRILLIFL